jgi:hypothetical protein
MKVIWKLRVPSTSLVDSPELQVLPRRCYVLRLLTEEEAENIITLTFDDVIAYRCTYDWGCNATVISEAYDKLVDYGNTQWLGEIAEVVRGRSDSLSRTLKHVGIYFDDGPHYEFICRDVRIADGSSTPEVPG